MLRVLAGVSILALAATTASAADLPVAVPAVVPVPVFTWTGCYVGGHIGAAFSDYSNTNSNGSTVDYGSTGFVGGGQIGCDYQFGSNWVVGAEGRGAWSSLKVTRNSTLTFLRTGATVPAQFTTTTDFLASATGRLGYVYGGGLWMSYLRGGAAWTHDKYDEAFVLPGGPPVDPAATSNRAGWTIGAGMEWAFAPHWSLNLEYDYYDFGTQTFALVNSAPAVDISGFRIHDRISTFTTGVNYHF
jgi:outer membrane immunogenic protein